VVRKIDSLAIGDFVWWNTSAWTFAVHNMFTAVIHPVKCNCLSLILERSPR